MLHTLPSTAETKSELSTAHVALAELFMTDLCDEEEAAAEAKRHINLATEVDPSNPEGWQVHIKDYRKMSFDWRLCMTIVF